MVCTIFQSRVNSPKDGVEVTIIAQTPGHSLQYGVIGGIGFFHVGDDGALLLGGVFEPVQRFHHFHILLQLLFDEIRHRFGRALTTVLLFGRNAKLKLQTRKA